MPYRRISRRTHISNSNTYSITYISDESENSSRADSTDVDNKPITKIYENTDNIQTSMVEKDFPDNESEDVASIYDYNPEVADVFCNSYSYKLFKKDIKGFIVLFLKLVSKDLYSFITRNKRKPPMRIILNVGYDTHDMLYVDCDGGSLYYNIPTKRWECFIFEKNRHNHTVQKFIQSSFDHLMVLIKDYK